MDQTNQCEEQPYTRQQRQLRRCDHHRKPRGDREDDCDNYEHLVTLTATDECGNSTDYQFTIVVADTEAPAFVEALPADETVECDAIPAAAVSPQLTTAMPWTSSSWRSKWMWCATMPTRLFVRGR